MDLFFRKVFEPLILIRQLLLFGFMLTLVFSVFTSYLLLTSQGSEITIKLFSKFTPYRIHYQSLKGCLVDHIEMTDFSLESSQFDVTAKMIQFHWEFKNLFKTEKTLKSLDASDLKFILKKKKIELKKGNSPIDALQTELNAHLPFLFKIQDLNIQSGTFLFDNHAHFIQKLRIQGLSHQLSKIERIQYQGEWGILEAKFDHAIRINWDLNIKAFPFSSHFKDPILTKGKLILPNRKIEDPQNYLHCILKTPHFYFAQKKLHHLDIKVQGTLVSHQIFMKAIDDKIPFVINTEGKLSEKEWQGRIKSLQINHKHFQNFSSMTGTICLNWDQNKLGSKLNLLLDHELPLSIEAAIQKNKPYVLSGNIKAESTNIKKLLDIFPNLVHSQSKLKVDLKLSGTLFQPELQGLFSLKNIKIKTVPKGMPIYLNELNLTLNNKIFQIQGMGTLGQGQFTLQGKSNLFNSHPSLEVHFQGEKLLLSDTPEYRILANPDLIYTFKNNLPQLTGKIFVTEAQIKSFKNPDRIIPSSDVMIISKTNKKIKQKKITERQSFKKTETHIELILSENIFYQGNGFSTYARGKLALHRKPNEAFQAQGKLILQNGKYRAYGKVFDIVYGQILFSGGPLVDPIIDIKAQRKIQNMNSFASVKNEIPIVAGIQFTGNLKSPRLGFYSKPSMADSDIISYLIVGRPQSEINEAQSELLFEAVSHLAQLMGSARKDVHFDLAERLKLDKIGLSRKANSYSKPGANPLEDTVLILAKQLSDKLFLQYSLGLADSASQFGLRYALSKNVTLEAQTGNQSTSADVILSFEGH